MAQSSLTTFFAWGTRSFARLHKPIRYERPATMPDLDKAAVVIAADWLRDLANTTFWGGAPNRLRHSPEECAALNLIADKIDAGLLLPEGWVAVPREANEAMIEAVAVELGVRPTNTSARIVIGRAIRAMIQAAQGEKG